MSRLEAVQKLAPQVFAGWRKRRWGCISNRSQLAIEFPGYTVVKQVFKNLGYSIENIPINSNGINLEDIEKSQCKLLYVTPSHQYPTGVTIPIANRFKLIQWATKNNAYIIEDDYDSELSYNNRPIPALQGINSNNCVIYSSTFSKSLSPALRVSYLVLPITLLTLYKKYSPILFQE